MKNNTITRSDLVNQFATQHHLTPVLAEQVAMTVLTEMSQALAQSDRIEIRGFGSFEPRQRKARQARNPKTGETVQAAAKHSVHFKPGKELRERVNISKK